MLRRETDDSSNADRSRGDSVIAEALSILESRARKPGELLNHTETVANWFRLRLGGKRKEVFAVAWLDAQLRLIQYEELFEGTLDYTSVHPREVVLAALGCDAAAAIVAHNHPSGCRSPSRADIVITRELHAALLLVGVRLLDHFIVTARCRPLSMALAGMALPSIEHFLPGVDIEGKSQD